MPLALSPEDEMRDLARIMCGDQLISLTGTDNLKWLTENKLVSGNEQKARTKSPKPWAVLQFAELVIKTP